jgi:hypothetical protein
LVLGRFVSHRPSSVFLSRFVFRRHSWLYSIPVLCNYGVATLSVVCLWRVLWHRDAHIHYVWNIFRRTDDRRWDAQRRSASTVIRGVDAPYDLIWNSVRVLGRQSSRRSSSIWNWHIVWCPQARLRYVRDLVSASWGWPSFCQRPVFSNLELASRRCATCQQCILWLPYIRVRCIWNLESASICQQPVVWLW